MCTHDIKLENKQKNFWNEKIKPKFPEKALNHQVKLLNGKLVTYANLDNAATTTVPINTEPPIQAKEALVNAAPDKVRPFLHRPKYPKHYYGPLQQGCAPPMAHVYRLLHDKPYRATRYP